MTIPDTDPSIAAFDAAPDPNPFRGLVPYEERDTLFARDADVDLIQSRMWSSRTTVLFAGSGVGKTSFLNAKLMPTLKNVFGAGNLVMPVKWALTNPAAAIAAARAQVRDGESSRRGSIIVLDQFEEIFQHLSKPQMLRDAGDQLAEIVQDERANVRLLLSIREEFLADLSLFDVFVPGVLTNYYRLGRLTQKHARLIIENTARLGGRGTDNEHVALLIDDLSAVHDATQSGGLFVDPPYLQIVCRRIWARESGSEAPFLRSYSEGEASRELQAYCSEKLAAFSWTQRKIVARAIQQLTGPYEAKKPARVSELAVQIGANEAAVTRILHSLSRHDVRILRQWPDQEVFELYHDMYAPMLWKWKTEQEQRERRRSFVTAVVLAAAALWLVVWPVFNWARASVFLTATEVSTISQRDVSTVLDMRNAFASTVVLRPVGDWLWREYTHRLETLSALLQDSDGAMGYRLAGFAAGDDIQPDRVDAVLGPGAQLEGAVTHLAGVTDAALDGAVVVIGTNEGKIIRWNFASGLRSNIPVVAAADDPDAWKHTAVTQDSRVQKSRVLCLSADGRHAAVVWFSGDSQAGTFGVIDTQTGKREPSLAALRGDGDYTQSTFRAAFSPDNSRLVAIHSKGVIVLGRTSSWEVPLRDGEMVVDAAFVSDDVLAVATPSTRRDQLGQPYSRITFWKADAHNPRGSELTTPETLLPPRGSLVTDGRGGFLAMIDSKWQWISQTSARSVTVPAGMWPKAFAADAPLLVSFDASQRIAVSDPDHGSENQFHFLAMTASRTALPAERRLTPAGIARLRERRLLSIDDNATAVRLWNLRSEAAFEDRHPQAPVPVPEPAPKGTLGRSVNGQWLAWVQGARVCVGPVASKETSLSVLRDWDAPFEMFAPRSVFISSKGDRVVVITDNEGLWYGDSNGRELKQFSTGQGDVAFGPGPQRITVFSAGTQLLEVFRPAGGKTTAEWRAPVRSDTFLVHSVDDDAVVFYSGFWIHRMTQRSDGGWPRGRQWPHIVSVLRKSPVNSVRPDPDHSDRVYVDDWDEPVDFTAEEHRLDPIGSRWLSSARLAVRTIRWCSEENEPAARGPMSGACEWEVRSGRRLGTPPPQ